MRLIATRVAAAGNVGSTPVCDFERVVVSPLSVWQHVAGLRRREKGSTKMLSQHTLRNAEHAEGLWPKQTLAIKKRTPHLLEGVNGAGRPLLDEQNERVA